MGVGEWGGRTVLVRRWISVTVATIASLGAALAVPQAAVAAPVPAGFSVAGIDVSSHDHAFPLDWTAVAASGVRFAYVKATEGTGYVNPYFAGDYAAAKAAGLATGGGALGPPPLGGSGRPARLSPARPFLCPFTR